MSCQHLERLAMDIKDQGILAISDYPNEIELSHESIFFDCHLDRKSIRQKYNFPAFIIDYISPETSAASKEGFICIQCNYAIIGVQKGYMPGSKTVGYNDAGQPHVFYFEDNNTLQDHQDLEKPIDEKKKRRGVVSIVFAILLGIPIALYQYVPHNMKLGFIAGICTLLLIPLILSPITQKIRGKNRYAFPFAPIFIVFVIGTPAFVLYGWQAIYYVAAGYAGLSLFVSIFMRIFRKND